MYNWQQDYKLRYFALMDMIYVLLTLSSSEGKNEAFPLPPPLNNVVVPLFKLPVGTQLWVQGGSRLVCSPKYTPIDNSV